MVSPKELAEQARKVAMELLKMASLLDNQGITMKPAEVSIEPDRIVIKKNQTFHCIACGKPVIVANRDIWEKSKDPNKGLNISAFIGAPNVTWPPKSRLTVNKQGGVAINCPLCGADSGIWLYRSPR